jgi:ADP-ribose pyrophosphatase YjhB (NUDIX family)
VASDKPAAVPGDPERVRSAAVRLAALAQGGLTYAQSPYDRDRYESISAIAAELLSVLTGRPASDLALEIGRDSGYATPKVDVRGALFDEHERVLLMRERSDGLWSLPGGWADPGDTPSGSVVREVLEESGYPVEVVKLVGCWDRDTQGHLPALPVAVFKLFFLCRVIGDPVAAETLETLDVGWFALDALPPLSYGRVTDQELRRCLAHHRVLDLPTELD